MNEESLFHEALARSTPHERSAFLAARCANQPQLREAVEALLAAHDQPGTFLSFPPAVQVDEPGNVPAQDTVNRAGETDAENRPETPETVDAAAAQSSRSPVDASPAAEVPARIGRYEIRRLLGRGGMGAVYLAHDPELDRPVALKVPRLSGPDAEERFLREARAAAAVTHPNLCPVYDAGRADGVLYLAMAYVPGSTLTEMLREKGPLSPAQAAAVAAGVARGMAEAHRHGIVHRDLKPGNILLNSNGEPVVTDFGLAFRASVRLPVASAAATVEHEPRLTQSGVLMGTPAYMPPEQARGDLDRIGPACDVYALGAILFELLTGRLPFASVPLVDMVRQIENQPAPVPSTIRRGVPAGIDAICRQALAKEPSERFDSMEAFAEALAPFASTSRWQRWRRTVAAAAAFLVLVGAGVIFYIATDNGTVEVRLSDPAANVQVSVDGNELRLAENGRVTKLRAGPHGLEVKGEGFETETKLFKVIRGEKTVVEVELKAKLPAAIKPGPLPALPDRTRLAGLLSRGRKLVDDARYGELEPIAAEALKIDPESPGALALRATYRHTPGRDRAGARADVEAALKLNPETFQALIVRAAMNGEEGKLDDAIADLTIAARLAPKHPAPYSSRSHGYFLKKEYRQAVADASRAIERGFIRPDAFLSRAAAYVYLGEYRKALADFDYVAEQTPNDPSVFIQRSAVHGKLGNAKQAAEDWAMAKQLDRNLKDNARLVIPSPSKPPERKQLPLQEAQKLERALIAFDRAWFAADLEGCRTAAAEACRIDPTCPAARSIRSRIWTQDERFKEAMDEATEAIRLNPDDAWAYSNRSASRAGLNDHAGAIADATIALRLDASNPLAWNNRAWAYLRLGHVHQALVDAAEAIRLRPSFELPYANRGLSYAKLAEYEKALADYETAAKLQPTNVPWRMMCAAIRARLGDADGARRDRELATKLDKKAAEVVLPVPLAPVKQDPEAHAAAETDSTQTHADHARLAVLLARGESLIKANRFLELDDVVNDALQIDPESPGALALRATYRADRRDFIGARADAEAALKLNQETFQACIIRQLCRMELREGTPADCIADLTIALRLRPDHAVAWSNRALMYYARGEYRQAIADATRSIELLGPYTWPLQTRAAAYASLGEYPSAFADYSKAIELAPNDPRSYIQRSALHARMGQEALADADWRTATKLAKKDLQLRDRPVFPDAPKPPERKKLTPEQAAEFAATLQAAENAWNLDRFDDCRKAVEQAVRIDPTSAPARSLRARVWVTLGHNKEAIEEANEALRLNPDDNLAYIHRGLALNRLKDSAGAIADDTIAIRLRPTNSIAWNNRGFAYMGRGLYYQAIADLDEAIRLRPDYVNALTNRGSCYLRLGEYEKARADYETATKLQPANARWWRMTAALRALLGDPAGARKDRERAVAIEPQLADAPELTLPVPLRPAKHDPKPQ